MVPEVQALSDHIGARFTAGWRTARQKHDRANCPAREATCHKCVKIGHFRAVCRSSSFGAKNTVHELEDSLDVETVFLGEIKDTSKNYWGAYLQVDGNTTHFKLDSGAAVTVLSDGLQWLRGIKLKPVGKRLCGPGKTKLEVLGQIKAILQHKNRRVSETVYVVRNQDCSLFSRKACEELNLLIRVEELGDTQKEQANFRAEFPQLFTGLGKLEYEYYITLSPGAKPVCLYTPRRVPHPLLPKVKKEIDSMLEQEVISPVTEPTKWCSGMVPVPKPSGAIRICVDLTQLNKAVEREVHPMASVDESLAKLGKGTIFTKLDADSGFWQLPLDEESKLLTTFITPFGRFCFNKLPFGISSAPEIFQHTMSGILEGLEGVIYYMDDVLIHGATTAEHDTRVRAVLQRVVEAGLTLNSKCEFSRETMKFLGHIVDATGVKIDPEKTWAIREVPAPRTITELQRFMGIVHQVGKFLPNLVVLRVLLRKDNGWCWEEPQQRAFVHIKKMMKDVTEVLAHYDPSLLTTIAADASSTGVGAILLQTQKDGHRRPVCYASRSLTETEQRYAVIEKEALAATWACEKFSDYVLGMSFNIETDHKPLVTLLNTKELSKLPPRVLRFRLRLMRYDATTEYVPEKQQATADALSRAPVASPKPEDIAELNELTEAFASSSTLTLPATDRRLEEIRDAQRLDEECALIREYCEKGWPDYMPHNSILRQYFEQRGHLSVIDDLLMYDERLVIPRALRLDILQRLHQGHLGITKCRARARQSVWWPGLSKSAEEMISRCTTCTIHSQETKEPLMTSSFPMRPWERLGMDLFEYQGKMFLIVEDYYSRWIEVKRLHGHTSEAVIKSLKEIFAVHGIPDVVISDNGPQFANETFQKFAEKYRFVHTTSSPRYPQANGEAERGVRTVKALLKKNDDIDLALLS
ncbi:uncharacterized protein K02A2.6-like [Strongylocentrotus purpuratus]|uniref:RNA-directed DNA polymerase n=1 Tax=Strongylocentrotus purpuratus TaxID=7668 RepID=A0A7M7P7J0_STRPU|nr:uncharacterized protein K02A2.6-like [Strongylocentrotus purpuratus]